MRIVINIPESFNDDEIVVNINREGALPFTDDIKQEDMEEELTPKEVEDLNAIMNYYVDNMYGDIEVEEEPLHLSEFGGDIKVG